MTEKLRLGSIVVSKAGHDRGNLLMVAGIESGGEVLLLVDGKRRPAEKPKRKKLRHVILTKGHCQRAAELLEHSEAIENALVKRELKEYGNIHLKETGGC